jgi:hypothetical protein
MDTDPVAETPAEDERARHIERGWRLVVVCGAVGVGASVWRSTVGHDPPADGTRIVGAALAPLFLAFLVGGITWVVTRRSVGAFQKAFGITLLVGAAASAWGGWKAHQVSDYKAELQAGMDSLVRAAGRDDLSAMESAQDRLLETAARAPGSRGEEHAATLRSVAEAARPIRERVKEYEDAAARFFARACPRGTEPDLATVLAARHQELMALLALAREVEARIEGLDLGVANAMDREGLSAEAQLGYLRATSGLGVRQAQIAVARQEVRLLDLYRQQLDLLRAHVGQWVYEAEGDVYAFRDPALRTRFSALAAQGEEARQLQEVARARWEASLRSR